MRERKTRNRAIAAALLACALLGGGYAWWRDGGKRLFFPRNWGVVEAPWLYRSGQIHPRIIERVLRDEGVDVVIDLAKDDPRVESAVAEQQAVAALGVRKVDLWGLNGSGVGKVSAYVGALEEMVRAREAGEKVLVHCAAGSERTGGAVALYRMLYQGWSGDRAWEEYLSYRNRPPRHTKLRDFLNGNMGEIAERLVRSGALAEAPAELPVFGP
ncbi:MAG: dual specificity protein phosphatase family protein [Myxococcota bacterium]